MQISLIKAKSRIRHFLGKPYNVLLVCFTVVLIVTVLLPMLSVVRDTFVIHNKQEAMLLEAPAGSFTLKHWINLFTDTEFRPFAATCEVDYAMPAAWKKTISAQLAAGARYKKFGTWTTT